MVSTAAMTAMPIMAPVSNDRRRSTGTGRVWALVNADLLWATAHVGCWAGSVAAAAAAGLQVRADQPFGEQTGGHRVDRLVQDVDHPTSPRRPGAGRRRRGRPATAAHHHGGPHCSRPRLSCRPASPSSLLRMRLLRMRLPGWDCPDGIAPDEPYYPA